MLISSFFCQTAVFAARPAISYRAIDLHASALSIGVIASSFAVLPLLSAIPIGRWVDRQGPKTPMLLGGLLLTADSLAMLRAQSVPVLALESALLGLGHILMAVGTQGYIAGRSTDGHDVAFSTLTVAVSAGQLTGPLVLAGLGAGHISTSGAGTNGSGRLLVAVGVAAALSTLAVLPVPTTDRRLRGSDDPAMPLSRSVRRIVGLPSMPQAMLASIAVLSSIDVLIAYLPLYGEEAGLSVATVGLLLTVRAAASLVVRFFTGTLLSWLGRARVLLFATLLPGLAFGLFPLLHHGLASYCLMAVAGAGLGLGQPLTMAWIAARSPRHLRGTALGVRLAGNRLGQLLIPTVAGVAASSAGAGVIFWFLMICLGGTSSVIWRTNFDPVPDSS